MAEAKAKIILIVDDDEMHNEILEVAFRRAGFEVIRASDGKDAIEKVKAARPDLITMDIMMPVMNGFEAIKALNAGGFGTIPVVVISAHQYYTPSAEEGLAVQEPNVLDVIRKPVILKKLVERIQQILKTQPR